MGQSSFVDALLPPGFGRNEKLERISGLTGLGSSGWSVRLDLAKRAGRLMRRYRC
jgi:hypothetical protein